jgi:signal transduction histidine kinase
LEPDERRDRTGDGSPDRQENDARKLPANPSIFASASRAFAVSMRAMAAERQRIKEERARLIRREQKALAYAEESQRRLARRIFELQAEERRRIGRELHDRVAHSIAVVHQSLELYEVLKRSDPAQAGVKLEVARRMAKSALELTRDLSSTLRDPELQEGLGAALSDLLRTTVSPEMRHELSVEGDESLIPPHVSSQLFSILREAIRNAADHSGGRRITVEVDVTAERVLGRVEDDGRGFDVEQARSAGSSGLRAMEERASIVGGALGVASTPDGGTRVKLSVPLTRAF